jgi:hypothetical protein
MSLDKWFDGVSVKVFCKDFGGSGVLIQPNSDMYTYVLTAKHCLEGTINQHQTYVNEDIKVKRLESDGRWTEFEVLDHKVHGDADLAVIVLKRCDGFEFLDIVEKEYRSQVTVYGYPKALEGQPDNPREREEGEVVRVEPNRFEFQINTPPGTFDHGDDYYLSGLSGSGIFIETYDHKIALTGIFIGMKEKRGAYRTHVGESIGAFNSLLADNKMPALAESVPMYMIKRIPVKYMYLSEWSREKRLNGSPWFEFERSAALIEEIQAHMLGSDELSVLNVVGRSGVGKTRSVLQACLQASHLHVVLYFESFNALTYEVKVMMKDSNSPFKIVVDDVTLEEWEQLNNEFGNYSSRIRIVTIGVVPENKLSSRLGIRPIIPPTDDDVVALMQRIDPTLLTETCKILIGLCEKDLRLVLLLLSANLTNVENLGPIHQIATPLYSVDSLMNRVLKQFQDEIGDIDRFKEIYTYLCLFIDIGIKESYRNELEYLSSYFHCDIHDLSRVITKAVRCSLGIDRSEFFEASPRVFARLFFENEGWNLVKDDLTRFMNGMPTTLMQKRFINRAEECSGMLREEVRVALATWFWETFPEYNLTLIDDVEKAKIFKVYTEFSPATGLQWLKNAVMRAGHEGLLNFQGAGEGFSRNKSRRYIVWLCEHLACFQEHFWDCEQILFLLAQHETEHHISNNSKGIWGGLFVPVLSNTEIHFIQRYDLLMLRLSEASHENIELICTAISSVFSNHFTRMVPPKVVGGRIVPEQWEPSSPQELNQLVSHAIDKLLTTISILSGNVQSKGIDFLIKNIGTLIDYGFLTKLKELLQRSAVSETHIRSLKSQLESYISRIDKFNHPNVYREQALEWKNQYQPQDLESRVIEFIYRNYWDYFHSGDEKQLMQETDELVQQIIESNLDLHKITYHIENDEVDHTSLSRLVERIGFFDHAEYYKSYIIELLNNNRAVSFVLPYLGGATQRGGNLPPWVIVELNRNTHLHPHSTLDITVSVDISNDGFNRIMTIIRTTPDIVQSLYRLEYRDWSSVLGQKEMTELLNDILKHIPEEQSLQLILSLARTWYHRENYEPPNDSIIEILLKVLVLCLQGKGWFRDWDWNEVMMIIPQEYISQKCELLLLALVLWNEGHSQLDDYALVQLIKLGNDHTALILKCLSDVIVHEKLELRFFFKVFRGLFESLDLELVKQWVESQGVNRARLLARHIASPKPTAEDPIFVPPLTLWLLEKYEYDDRFFREFLSGRHSFEVYDVEEKINQHEKLVESMQPYLMHQLRRIQEWAKYEIQDSEYNRDDHELREARLNRE